MTITILGDCTSVLSRSRNFHHLLTHVVGYIMQVIAKSSFTLKSFAVVMEVFDHRSRCSTCPIVRSRSSRWCQLGNREVFSGLFSEEWRLVYLLTCLLACAITEFTVAVLVLMNRESQFGAGYTSCLAREQQWVSRGEVDESEKGAVNRAARCGSWKLFVDSFVANNCCAGWRRSRICQN